MTKLALPLLASSAVLLAGCGALDGPMTSNVSDDLTAQNGLANNGLANNGLANNGLANNGLANNGLATSSFESWFGADPALADMVMRYVVRCAYPDGSSLSYSYGGTTYVWYGLLGLAPDWSAGSPATEKEQQVITACLASLANKYGKSVPISIQGRSATGVPIPLATDELTTYSVEEACFFGNLFKAEGVFVGLDHKAWSVQVTSARACALDVQLNGSNSVCPPIYQTGYCREICTLDPSGTYYTRCSWNGVAYSPMTTRLRPAEVYTCGDGVCQFTEQCGLNNDGDSCRADCGTCN
jgi:hypothetical protein